MAHKSGENTDPFYLIWDEADKSATVHSNLGQLLSEFGGYGFRCCLVYQAPSNQLPDSLRDATESQIDTTLSFRTTGKDANFIKEQHTVEKDDLDSLPPLFVLPNDRYPKRGSHGILYGRRVPAGPRDSGGSGRYRTTNR